MRKLLIAFAFAVPALSALAPVSAQIMVPPTIIRGTIESVTPNQLTVTDRTGAKQVLVLADDARVAAIATIGIDAIKPGSFIGTAAAPGPRGTLRALEVHVFPESMRGTGEGHRPWDTGAGSTMTNGTVGTVSGSKGRTIKVAYKGGEKDVVVPANVPIVTFEPGDRAMLVPGAHIMTFAMKDADGKLVTHQVSVGKNGITPPM